MKTESFKLRRENDSLYQCSRSGGGEVRLAFDPANPPSESELSLGSTFLGLGALQGADGLVLERTRLTAQEVPVLLCYPEKARRSALIVFQHGFTGYKELDLRYGIQLAKEGFFVVLPDARFHGERSPANFNDYFYDGNFWVKFLSVIGETTEDLIGLFDYFSNDERIDMDRVGMAGVSMGGYISFLTASKEPRIKAVAPMIASPLWSPSEPAREDEPREEEVDDRTRLFIEDWEPLRHAERLVPKALLIQNGMEDKTVPGEGARLIYTKLQSAYAQTPERLKLVEYPGVGHRVTDEMSQAMVDWFKRFL